MAEYDEAAFDIPDWETAVDNAKQVPFEAGSYDMTLRRYMIGTSNAGNPQLILNHNVEGLPENGVNYKRDVASFLPWASEDFFAAVKTHGISLSGRVTKEAMESALDGAIGMVLTSLNVRAVPEAEKDGKVYEARNQIRWR